MTLRNLNVTTRIIEAQYTYAISNTPHSKYAIETKSLLFKIKSIILHIEEKKR